MFKRTINKNAEGIFEKMHKRMDEHGWEWGPYSQFKKYLEGGIKTLHLTNMGIFDPIEHDDSKKPWGKPDTVHMWYLHLYVGNKLTQSWEVPYYGAGFICPELFADLLHGCAQHFFPH